AGLKHPARTRIARQPADSHLTSEPVYRAAFSALAGEFLGELLSSLSDSEVLRMVPPKGCMALANLSSVIFVAMITTAEWPGSSGRWGRSHRAAGRRGSSRDATVPRTVARPLIGRGFVHAANATEFS
ncbi:MAG TPA: hypothetical protein VFD73_17120, partial [Gemmatimonadales bacterium]|nr:hypothetical protein [Gemmatimonadales bacterium]